MVSAFDTAPTPAGASSYRALQLRNELLGGGTVISGGGLLKLAEQVLKILLQRRARQ